MFMNRWVAADRGAPPDNNTRKRPPNNTRTFWKTSLERQGEWRVVNQAFEVAEMINAIQG